MIWVELCCGSAAVTLRLLGCKTPPAPYMGGKRKYARSILDLMGVHTRPSKIILCDAGPWGRAWRVLTDPVKGPMVPACIAATGDRGAALFGRLSMTPPPSDDVEWCATFLMLQAGNFSAKPVGYCDEAWMTGGYGSLSPLAVEKGFNERLIPQHVARRAARVVGLRWHDVQVVEGEVASVDPIPGATVYIDPPYTNTTGYAADVNVEAIAEKWAAVGAHVAVSERRPVVEHWHHAQPTASGWQARSFGQTDEWLSSNSPLTPQPKQMELLC